MTLIENIEIFVQDHIRHYDPSHDWFHIHRVRNLAVHLAAKEKLLNPNCEIDTELVEICALLHDIADTKVPILWQLPI